MHPFVDQPKFRRVRRIRPAALLAVAAALRTTSALAAWPPSADTDPALLADPAYWPDDPEYGYRASAIAGDRQNGQWPLYSFVPDRSPGSAALRATEVAAGMSVDLAWRHGIGDPRIVIAIADSGIDWSERDLVDKIALNAGELQVHPPHHADGSACSPLDPSQPTRLPFDCNGDGLLSVSDYADDPALSPAADATHPAGDVNRNGTLDAQDLILAFSDGVDDDGNGYVDDIAGWDFADNDNDAFDATGTGHGTSSALIAAAQTNNGIGGAGVCPACRVLPVRTGDGALSEATPLGKALLFASDAGASVALLSTTTLDATPFLQAAIDQAAASEMTIVAAMGNQNSRHHAVPATANHVVAVSAATLMGPNRQSSTTTSFVAFDTCSNFGAQSLLAASSASCSDEAAAYVAGIAGLGYSVALAAGFDPAKPAGRPALDAAEMTELLAMTADDIDVEESREQASPFFPSQAGFDLRFGYGRANADRLMQWIESRKIPPAIDVTGPAWFTVFDPGKLGAPVKIMGTVRAARAISYDYSVEWAPGAEPLDAEFRTIASVSNVANTVTAGADGQPLGELDVRELDVEHERDPNSPMGEDDFTITIRVRATAHYGGQIGDVPGELRRAYAVHGDPDLLPGFPVKLGASGESSPKLADIDGDGVRDVVIATSDGKLSVYQVLGGEPHPLRGFPVELPPSDGMLAGGTPDYTSAAGYGEGRLDPSLARRPVFGSPAIADIDGDGAPEIVVTSFDGVVNVIEHDGSQHDGFPLRLPAVPPCPAAASATPEVCTSNESPIARGIVSSPVLADFDGDGILEIVVTGLDGFVHVLEPDGSARSGWPIRVHFPQTGAERYGPIFSTPVVTDFNGDGVPDVLVGSGERLGPGGDTGAVTIIDGRAADPASPYLADWPLSVPSLNLGALIAQGVPAAPAAADFDGDGRPEAVFQGNGSEPWIVPAQPGSQAARGALPSRALPERTNPDGGRPVRGLEPGDSFGASSVAESPDRFTPLFGQPALGDLNQDGVPDIVTTGASAALAQNLFAPRDNGNLEQHLLAMWDGKTGRPLPGSPAPLEDFAWLMNPAIADITGDGYPEVIVGTGGYMLHAIDACGREATGWPKFTGQWLAASPAVGDVSGDGRLNVVAVTRGGWLYAWRTQVATSTVIAWESFHHDNRNTGLLETPLDQGRLMSGSGPLPLDDGGRCIEPGEVADAGPNSHVVPAGGCSCALAARQRFTSRWATALLAAWALLRRRHGRRT